MLRQLILLEQHYETDEIVLALCAQKARLFPRYGMSQITDDLLMKEVNLTVNVGMGASNPQQRMQNFVVASNAVMSLVANAPPSMNIQEMSKEIWSNAGYRDGARFMSEQQDPRLMKAMQIIQQLQGTLNGKQMDLRATAQVEQLKIASNEKIKGAEIQVNNARIEGDLQIRQGELAIERAKLVLESQKLELEKLSLQLEAERTGQEMQVKMADMQTGLQQAEVKLQQEQQKLVGLAMKIASEAEQAQVDLKASKIVQGNEEKISGVVDQVTTSMSGIANEVNAIKQTLSSATEEMDTKMAELKRGLVVMAGEIVRPKRKPRGFKLKKDGDQRTHAVVIDFDDGSAEEMSVTR